MDHFIDDISVEDRNDIYKTAQEEAAAKNGTEPVAGPEEALEPNTLIQRPVLAMEEALPTMD